MVYGLLKRYLGLLFLSACIIPNLFAGVTQKKEKPVMFQVRKDIKYQVIVVTLVPLCGCEFTSEGSPWVAQRV